MVMGGFYPRKSYTYDDIGLVPRRVSTITSRKAEAGQVDLTTDFLGNILQLPITVSPMESVVGTEMSLRVTQLGGLPIIPRTVDFWHDQDLWKQNKDSIPSIPATGDFLDRFKALREMGCNHYCIDVANGFHVNIANAVEAIRKLDEDCYLITGNVASFEGYKYLAELGIDAVRVGIGGGSACTTSIATGVGIGQASAIQECASYKGDNNISTLIIADGGIRTPGDVAKAIALGADVVMIGGLFAGTKESPGKVVIHEGKKYKHLAGQASMTIKGSEEFVEGEDMLVPYVGKVEKLWKAFDEGLRSSMAYMNCTTLEQLRGLPSLCFTELSDAAKAERKAHAKFK